MPRSLRPLAASVPFLILFLAVVAVGLELARPFRSASIAFDSQAAVLYFERIVSGQRLEQAVTTTPKPLVTAVFGLLYELTHDWRALAWMTLLVDGLAVTLTAVFAWRVGGPIAAAFTGVALANDGNLLFDVGYALASPYALLGWAVAGLAVNAPRPRFALAGLALAVATLARVETLVLIGAIGLALSVASVVPRNWRLPRPPARAWLVPLVGLLALPVMLVHDQLLTGDPLYWTGVAGHYAAGTSRSLPAASQVVRDIVERYWLMSFAVVLAAVGVVQLLDQRRYWLLVALAGLGPGIAAFLVFLAFRGLDVPIRYAVGVDVALFVAAGIGLGAISLRLRSWPPLDRARGWLGERAAGVAMVALVGFLAILATGPYWRQNPNIRANVRTSRDLAAATDRALPSIAAALRSAGVPVPGKPIVLVPGAIRPRLVVDLRTSLEEVGGVAAGKIDVAAGYPSAGQVVFHVRDADPKVAAWGELEIEQSRTIGSVHVEPLFTDPGAGIWVVALR